MTKLTERITDLLKGPVEQTGYELWDVEYQKEGKQWFLRVFVDHPNGISLDDCVVVNHAVDPILESNDIIPQEYILEVSSPGVYRPLKKPEHFIRFVGETIQVRLYEALTEGKKFKGRLEFASLQEVHILLENQERLVLSYQQMAKAELAP